MDARQIGHRLPGCASRVPGLPGIAHGSSRARGPAAMPTPTPKVIAFESREAFVATPLVDAVCRRAATYLDSGFPVHFRGSAGTGKTTLAMHVANGRGRPVTLMFGDDSFQASDLIGRDKGVQTTRVVD